MGETKVFILQKNGHAVSEEIIARAISRLPTDHHEGDKILVFTGPQWNKPRVLAQELHENGDSYVVLVDLHDEHVDLLTAHCSDDPMILDLLDRAARTSFITGMQSSWRVLYKRARGIVGEQLV